MIKKMIAISAAISAIAAMLISVGAAQAADACVWVRNINDFRAANDEKSLMISDSPSRKYTVSLMGRCTGLRFAETIAVRSVGDMFCLQPGNSISFISTGISRRCMINGIAPLEKPADSGQQGSTQPQGY